MVCTSSKVKSLCRSLRIYSIRPLYINFLYGLSVCNPIFFWKTSFRWTVLSDFPDLGVLNFRFSILIRMLLSLHRISFFSFTDLVFLVFVIWYLWHFYLTSFSYWQRIWNWKTKVWYLFYSQFVYYENNKYRLISNFWGNNSYIFDSYGRVL